MQSGDLKSRITFQRKGDTRWENVAPRWARIVYLRGDETVIAGRLTGRNTAVISVRADRDTKTVHTAWRIKDRNGVTFNIRSIIPSGDGAWIDFTCETDGPTRCA